MVLELYEPLHESPLTLMGIETLDIEPLAFVAIMLVHLPLWELKRVLFFFYVLFVHLPLWELKRGGITLAAGRPGPSPLTLMGIETYSQMSALPSLPFVHLPLWELKQFHLPFGSLTDFSPLTLMGIETI